MDDLFQTMFDSAYKYGSAPFRTPHEMVVDEIDLSSRMLIAHIPTTIPSSSEELNPPTARLLHVQRQELALALLWSGIRNSSDGNGIYAPMHENP
jgi:hypothetical protein